MEYNGRVLLPSWPIRLETISDIHLPRGDLPLGTKRNGPQTWRVASVYESITRGAARCRPIEGGRFRDKDAHGTGRKLSERLHPQENLHVRDSVRLRRFNVNSTKIG